MKERPIIFNSEMVKAILEGKKTQTRRIMNPQLKGEFIFDPKVRQSAILFSPYGLPLSRLWVRESFWERKDHISSQHDLNAIHYDADLDQGESDCRMGWAEHSKLRPSIHMPRWASRITLEIVNVRIERIQDITGSEIYAEGYPGEIKAGSCHGWFKDLWDSINAKKGFGWDKNPFCWVIEFKRIT